MHLFNKKNLTGERTTKKEDKNAASIKRRGSMWEESVLGHISKSIHTNVSVSLTLPSCSM